MFFKLRKLSCKVKIQNCKVEKITNFLHLQSLLNDHHNSFLAFLTFIHAQNHKHSHNLLVLSVFPEMESDCTHHSATCVFLLKIYIYWASLQIQRYRFKLTVLAT